MKTVRNLMIALFAITAFVACKDKEEPRGGMVISENAVQISESGDDYVIVLTSPGAWQSSINLEAREWLSVKPTSGSGGSGMEIVVKAAPMKEGQTREGVVTLSLVSGEGQVSITFTRGKVPGTRKSDSTTLVALYNATQGSTSWRMRWDLASPINTWDSVKTEVIEGQLRVVELNLSQLNLTNKKSKASLPELGHLTELRVLDISQEPHDISTTSPNMVTGAIPSSLGELKKLRVLNMAYNGFTGEIPAGLLANPALEILDLQLNKISGSINAEISGAQALRELRLNSNKMTGEIPAAVAELANLEVLDLSRNELGGALPNFNNLKKLQVLNISYNAKYEEKIQETDDKEGFFYKVYVSGGFNGKVELTGMNDLTMVNLAGCHFMTSPKIVSCPKLTDLFVADNEIGALDPSIFDLASCRSLYLDNAGITTLPEVLNLGNLENLYLQHNQIKEIPESLKTATKLIRLYLGLNEFEVLPDIFGGMTKMEDFQMGYGKNEATKFRGVVKSVPASLWTMPSLQKLLIHMNAIEGTLPTNLSAMSQNLAIFNVSFNYFTGSIDAVTDLARAEWVLLSVNKFNGTLPENIDKMTMVSAFAVDDNYMTGGIPASVVKCVRLKDFHLMTNCFDGVIPYIVFKDTRWGGVWLGDQFIKPQREGYAFKIETEPPTAI